MNTFRTIVLILASISFIVVIGGAVYEHAGIVPVWASAAPASLAMFQGEYAITPFKFWIPIHPITMLLLLLSLVFNWRSERRNSILTTIVGYAIVLAVTFLYFVPELMSITQSVYGATIDPELTERAQSWEFWSQVRLASLLLMAFILLFGLSKSPETLRRRY
jgi:hypothetical protein